MSKLDYTFRASLVTPAVARVLPKPKVPSRHRGSR